MTPEEELRRADKAKEVLGNPIYVESVKSAHDEIINQLVLTEDTDKDRFHALGLKLKQHHQLIRELQRVMETGRLAQETLKEKARGFFSSR